MRKTLATALLLATCGLPAAHADDHSAKTPPGKAEANQKDSEKGALNPSDLGDDVVLTDGSLGIGGGHLDYQAATGVLLVHPKDWDDAPSPGGGKDDDDKKASEARATMSFVAYFKKGVPPEKRPIMFVYNGGPGSSTVWLHMGAFGPKRVVTRDDQHTPAAPYTVVDNQQSLLDVTDLVFVDAPGTGFGRLAGKDKEKAFWGTDQDANAFADFITRFLGRYGRWNSPKYLFGESYGTTRSAVLSNILENDKEIDLNGIVLLSQILNFNFSVDQPEDNPGIDAPYELALPTYAATAWYHHKLPDPHPDLPAFLNEVQAYAIGDYAAALAQGSALDDATRDKVVARLHAYTGLPASLILRAHLRIAGGVFEHDLLQAEDMTTGRLDTRFSGPSMDPLEKDAAYDPQSAAISSAYVASFNDYVRRTLHYGAGKTYRPEINVFKDWEFKHQAPGDDFPNPGTVNVMPDLAAAMKYDPDLKVQLNAGYYDLATPYFEGIYEMHHLPMPHALQANISYHQYDSGHMVYAHAPSLAQLHDNVAAFVRQTDRLGGGAPANGSTDTHP